LLLPDDQAAVNSILKKQLISYSKHGYTSIAATGFFPFASNCLDEMDKICKSDSSPIRLIIYHREDMMKPDYVPDSPGANNPCLIGVKIWADGSPYSATMATKDPYLETEMTLKQIVLRQCPCYGELHFDTDDLCSRLLPYHQKGFQLAAHTQGERAIEQILDVYQKLLEQHPRGDHRYRLEHCGLITRSLMERAKQLGVTLSFFPDHILFWGSQLKKDILGPERGDRFMPMNSAKQVGLRWTVHSDSPCSPLGPFRVMKTCVTRKTRGTNEVIGPEERVSVDDIIRAYTIEAAWQVFHDKFLGSLEVGKIADLLVISENPRKMEADRLDTIQVCSVYKAGKMVDWNAE
jgi:predicted amidohydrolase YtcJ